ncbi:MAG: hypothetical protein SGJ09_14440 [Phycisphaerae bacterium]|nr:hypothetical protein [Phycisphaerae bacterium]
MIDEKQPPPEPLQAFGGLADAVVSSLQILEAAYTKYREHREYREYREHRDAGRILPNSVEALRVELTT